MRKQFASSVRVVQVPKMAPATRRLSLEEEALILDQSFRDEAACTAGLDEAHRLTEVADALEDLAALASQIREASPTEIALVQTAGQMGVAGTTNEPEMLLPAMESFQEGKSIACESIGQKAKTLMKNVLEFIARVWERMVSFYRMHVVVADLRGKIRKMEEMLKSNTKGVVLRAASLDEFAGWFTFRGKLLTKTDEMVNAMKATAETARFLFEDLPSAVQKSGEQVEHLLANFKPETSDQTVQGMVKNLTGIRFDALPHAQHESQDGTYDVHTSDAFIGGGQLVAKVYRAQPGVHPYAALDAIRNSGVSLERGDGQASGWQVSGAQFNYPQGPGAFQVLKAADSLLAVIENYHTKHVAALKAVADRLKAASQKAAAALEASSVDETGEQMRDFKAAINFNTTFARWSQNPSMPFYSNVVKTCRFSLMLVQFGLGQ
jgi:hypothetical protein